MSWRPKIQSTLGYGVSSLSCLIYGPSGAGKTTLAATTGSPAKTIILAAEPGLLPLRHLPVKWIEIDSLETLDQVLGWLEEAGRAGKLAGMWVILDSVSEIAERVLASLKAKTKDPRAAYGDVQDRITQAMKRVRSLPCHTVCVAKQERMEDDAQRLVYGPAFPGKRLAAASVYEFDLVLAMRVGRDAEGRVVRWLQTQPDGKYEAKDRSGALDEREPPDLAELAKKVMGAFASAEPAAPAGQPEATYSTESDA